MFLSAHDAINHPGSHAPVDASTEVTQHHSTLKLDPDRGQETALPPPVPAQGLALVSGSTRRMRSALFCLLPPLPIATLPSGTSTGHRPSVSFS